VNKDIRWQQRYNGFRKALSQLQEFVDKGKNLNKLEQTGMIKAFEFTYELAWNTIKDFYEDQGESGLQGSRDVLELAFRRGLIKNGQGWMSMLKDRNRTAHTYNEITTSEIAGNILSLYHALFELLSSELENILNKNH
jgi:nucleotidyltransferase substrate binding protein (TIGR01987 family)